MTREGWWVFIGVALVLSTTCGRCVAGAQRQPDDDVLQLSRALVSEIGYTATPESWEVLHVLEYRRAAMPALRHLTLAGVARRYCSELNGSSHTARARVTRSLRLADIPAPIVAQVRRWLGGERPAQSCRGATDWASPEYVRRHGMRAIRCGIDTTNAFVRRR